MIGPRPYGHTDAVDERSRGPLSRIAVRSVWFGAMLTVVTRLHFAIYVAPTSFKPDLTIVPYTLLAMAITLTTVVLASIGAIRLFGNGERVAWSWLAAGVVVAIAVLAYMIAENWKYL